MYIKCFHITVMCVKFSIVAGLCAGKDDSLTLLAISASYIILYFNWVSVEPQVIFLQPAEARAAFKGLAYKRYK